MGEFKWVKAESWSDNDEDFVWESGQIVETATAKFTDELNATLSADTKGIGKLINKYAVSDLDDVGYGCCWLRIEFDGKLTEREDWKELEGKIDEYLGSLIFDSNWLMTYSRIDELNDVGATEFANGFDNATDAIECYIDSLYECGFTDDDECLHETFEEIAGSKGIIDKHLMFRSLSGKYVSIKSKEA